MRPLLLILVCSLALFAQDSHASMANGPHVVIDMPVLDVVSESAEMPELQATLDDLACRGRGLRFIGRGIRGLGRGLGFGHHRR